MTTPTTVPLDPAASWVLVGNGPSAIRRRLGAVIDAHDYVVRCNRYETAPHEDQVGARVTHWATHGLPWTAPDGSRNTPMCPGELATRPRWALMVHAHVPCPIEVEASAGLRRGSLGDLVARLGQLGARPRTIPSTGITTLYWLLRDAGVRRVHLVGMDGFAKTRSKAHHYWSPRAYKRPAEHDGDAELRLLRHWAAVGRVAFLS